MTSRATMSSGLSSSRNAALRRRKLRTTSQRRPHVKKTRSGNYKVWYRDLDGHQRTKTFPDSARWTRAELDRAVDHLLRPINDVRAAALHDDTLWSIWCGWRATVGRHMKPSTRVTYQRLMRKLETMDATSWRVSATTRADIHGLLLRLKTEGYAPHTIQAIRKILSTLFTFAIESGLRDTDNPAHGKFKGIGRPRNTRPQNVLEPGQITSLLDALPLRDRVAVAIAAFAGLRKGEIAALRWNDIPDDCLSLRVDESDYLGHVTAPKTDNARRTVHVATPLGALLREWRDAHPDRQPDDFLFVGRTGKPLDLSSAMTTDTYRNAFAAAGLTPCGWHMFRHSHATWARNVGVPAEALAKHLGHADVTTVLSLYSHRTHEAPDAAAVAAYGTDAARHTVDNGVTRSLPSTVERD